MADDVSTRPFGSCRNCLGPTLDTFCTIYGTLQAHSNISLDGDSQVKAIDSSDIHLFNPSYKPPAVFSRLKNLRNGVC
jgi:hypothetical protein